MKSVGHIYCVTCLPTGKLYFGQTVTPIGDRWVRHLSSSKKGSNHKFHRAIRKYGAENFIIEEVLTVSAPTKEILKKKLDYVEMRLIKRFNTKIDGYNSTDGGDKGTVGLKMSEEAKKKISEAKRRENLSDEQRKKLSESKIGEKNPFYHRTHSEDSRQRISEKKRGENHHFFGKKFTDEHRKKLSEARQRYLKNKLNS
jgi:group I intron endonuclease